MPLRLYNSLKRQKEEFVSLKPGKVSMYICGITAYDECHLGHARAAVSFDVIYRYLKYLDYDVTYIRNFTDVDDKIIQKSQQTGESCEAITERYIQSYTEQMQKLKVLAPNNEPRATQHIAEMIQLVQDLEAKGLAYESGGDVFYAVRGFNDYGKLANKKLDDLETGARVEVDTRKKDPLDFVLWKAAKPDEPQWDSPWGKGRPGWHLECSAMSMKYLGQSFDIHGGGRDLIFPHHENEIAQSEGATGETFVKYWLHNGFVNIDAEKMSKSLGNIRSIPAILEQWDPEVVRYFLLSAHYASPIDFTENALSNAQDALTRFYQSLARLKDSSAGSLQVRTNFKEFIPEAMDDDFNTAAALGRVFEWVRELNSSLDQGNGVDPVCRDAIFQGIREDVHEVLGILGSEPNEFLERMRAKGLAELKVDEAQIQQLIAERIQARTDKNWARADEIRDSLAKQGITLKDNPDGTTGWEVK